MTETEIFLRLFLALIFGALIGLERELKRKEAGLQTYSLITLGACLFTLVALSLGNLKILDPSPLVIAISVGMGFIGAGAIFKSDTKILGLTTAAGLWTAAAIGFAVGAGFYLLATLATFLVVLILRGFGLIEERFLK